MASGRPLPTRVPVVFLRHRGRVTFLGDVELTANRLLVWHFEVVVETPFGRATSSVWVTALSYGEAVSRAQQVARGLESGFYG